MASDEGTPSELDGEPSEALMSVDKDPERPGGRASDSQVDMESRALLGTVPDVTVTGTTDDKPDPAQDKHISHATKSNGIEQTVLTLSKCDEVSTATLDGSHEADSEGCRPGQWLRKNEYLVLILGSVTFLVGCIVMAVGVYMMQTRVECTNGVSSSSPSGTGSVHHYDVITANHESSSPPTGGVSPAVPSSPLPRNISIVQSINSSSNSNDPPAAPAPELENLAEGRSARQSSTWVNESRSYPAALAVDGTNLYTFASGSCARTETESQPYWMVDLGSLQLVNTVSLNIPRDGPAGELHNFEIRIGQENDMDMNPLCRHYMGTALVFTLRISCERPMYGRYVSVKMLGDKTRTHNRLSLCEVRVYNS